MAACGAPSWGAWNAFAALAVTVGLWASAFVAIRVLLPALGAGGVASARLALAAVAFGLIAMAAGVRRPTRAEVPGLAVALTGTAVVALSRRQGGGVDGALLGGAIAVTGVVIVQGAGSRTLTRLTAPAAAVYRGGNLLLTPKRTRTHTLTPPLFQLLYAPMYQAPRLSPAGSPAARGPR